MPEESPHQRMSGASRQQKHGIIKATHKPYRGVQLFLRALYTAVGMASLPDISGEHKAHHGGRAVM